MLPIVRSFYKKIFSKGATQNNVRSKVHVWKQFCQFCIEKGYTYFLVISLKITFFVRQNLVTVPFHLMDD
jgi:hypothetical protein